MMTLQPGSGLPVQLSSRHPLSPDNANAANAAVPAGRSEGPSTMAKTESAEDVYVRRYYSLYRSIDSECIQEEVTQLRAEVARLRRDAGLDEDIKPFKRAKPAVTNGMHFDLTLDEN